MYKSKHENLIIRTKKFALRVIRLANSLPNSALGNVIRYQLIKCGTSTAANYRAACRGKSRLDFIAKLGIVEEECDEVCFWIEIIIETKIKREELVDELLNEGKEILAIIISSKKTARKNKNRN